MQPIRTSAAASVAAAVLLGCSLNALAAGTTVIKTPGPQPAKIVGRPLVMGAEVVRDQWPGTLPLVNAPAPRTMALPGQCISIAVMAHGDDRDALLKDTAYSFEVELAGQRQKFDGLHPASIKRLKPEGGDFVMGALDAAGADKGSLPELSMASLATFELNWCVPKDARGGKATISGSAVLPKGVTLRFEKTSLSVVSFDKAVHAGKFDSKEAFGDWVMTYYRQPNPARVLAACRLLADDNMAFALNVRVFLIEVLKSSPEAAADLQARLAGEQPEVRGYALYLLKHAGYDIGAVMARLPEQERSFQEEFLRRAPPLVDPYDLQVNPAHFDLGERMDALWSTYLVTGRQKPVRAIAELLTWRDDYPAIREAQKTPHEKKALTVAMGRGVGYMIAGWSLGSFARHDPLVADFVAAWKADPATPKVLREELDSLLVNAAFDRSR